ncbi:hypothetical protein Scep_006510 [Stephania cephalantha]|uniref:Uncharacterized protein n=1 Tax=Stephania cephalantha TaxID=152367 RepID=A0AAP0K9U4_9MAGN
MTSLSSGDGQPIDDRRASDATEAAWVKTLDDPREAARTPARMVGLAAGFEPAPASKQKTGRGGTARSNGAVARCRADRSPTRQQQWTRRRDFDEARRRDGLLAKETRGVGRVAKVRARRHVSCPEPESAGLLPRLDLLVEAPCYLASLID